MEHSLRLPRSKPRRSRMSKNEPHASRSRTAPLTGFHFPEPLTCIYQEGEYLSLSFSLSSQSSTQTSKHQSHLHQSNSKQTLSLTLTTLCPAHTITNTPTTRPTTINTPNRATTTTTSLTTSHTTNLATHPKASLTIEATTNLTHPTNPTTTNNSP